MSRNFFQHRNFYGLLRVLPFIDEAPERIFDAVPAVIDATGLLKGKTPRVIDEAPRPGSRGTTVALVRTPRRCSAR